jgi:RecJ-like exonuclease
MKRPICPVCQGSGKKLWSSEVCPNCEGSGKMPLAECERPQARQGRSHDD